MGGLLRGVAGAPASRYVDAVRTCLRSVRPVAGALGVVVLAVSAPLAAQEAGPHPLVGVWGGQVTLEDRGDSRTLEIGMEIRDDGTMVDLGSRPVGADDDAWEGGGRQIFYRVQGSVLELSEDGESWAPFARFRFRRGGDLVFTYLQDGSEQNWGRIR